MQEPNTQKPEIYYTTAVTEAKLGETPIYRRKGFEDRLYDTIEGVETVQDLHLKNFREVPEKDALGRRVQLEDGSLDKKITWETYADLKRLATALGSGIINLGLTDEKAQFRDYKLRFVGIQSPNSREWFILDTANSLYNFVTMPLYDTLGDDALEFMYNQTELSTAFVTANHVAKTAQLAAEGRLQFLKNIVVCDPQNLTDEIRAEVKEGVTLLTFDEVIKAGEENQHEYATVTPDDILCFSYTSGTTGQPKGAMLTHGNIIAMVSSGPIIIKIKEGYTHLSYLPLPHIFERCTLTIVLRQQGRIAAFNGNPKKLLEDLAIVKPDFMFSVPRLFNKFTAAIKAQFAQAPPEKRAVIEKAVETKIKNLRENFQYTHEQYDELVFGKIKQLLGGNVKYLLSGAAPISQDVHEFFNIAMCCPFVEGYGQTEACAAQYVQDVNDGSTGNVGGPMPHLEFKLIDVPEMNYFSTDKDEQGRAAPRGEVLTRSKCVFPCYYKNEEKTAEMRDEEGWLHSGDIGMIVPENGALKIIDRRKNIFKLSIGEYVAPDRLQEVYKAVTGVSDIFITGNTLRSYLVGMVYSEPAVLERVAKGLGVEGTFEELCDNEKVVEHFVKALDAKQQETDLKTFEKVKKIKLSKKSFEVLGLLTSTFKIKRQVARIHFKDVFDALYAEDDE